MIPVIIYSFNIQLCYVFSIFSQKFFSIFSMVPESKRFFLSLALSVYVLPETNVRRYLSNNVMQLFREKIDLCCGKLRKLDPGVAQLFLNILSGNYEPFY